jgi:hypothetical protein
MLRPVLFVMPGVQLAQEIKKDLDWSQALLSKILL